jgi:hypothetical protein
MQEKFKVKIRGVVPLLMHRFVSSNEKPQTAKKQGRKGKIYDNVEDAKQAAYLLEDGTLYQPAEHLEGAMTRSATSYIIPGAGKKTYKDAVKGGVFIEPREIPHLIQGYEVDLRSVVIKGSRIERARPRFDNWELEFTINLVDERVTPEILKQILEDAGKFVGIGDFRPKFGRFEVTEFRRL